MVYRLLAIMTAFFILPRPGSGQIISVKTLPLIATSQFSLTPSYNAGMGGITIALDDTLADGFVNPARSTAIEKNFNFVAPYRDSWSERSAGSRWWPGRESTLHGSMVQALPAGTIRHFRLAGGSLRLTTGIAMSVEQLRHTSHDRQFWDPETREWNGPLQMSVMNQSLSAMAAVRIPRYGFALGLGFDAVKLNGVDGIPLLYPGASELRQDGYLTQYRLGASIDRFKDRRVDILLFHKRYSMEQDALYDWRDDIHNKDSERSWLVQVKTLQAVEENTQLGFEVTGQWKRHPKIPNYPAPEVSIPRDPGITKAGRLGAGFALREGKLLVASDLAVEIIDSRTWGDTTVAVVGRNNQLIVAGDPLFRNDYFFTNVLLRIGVEYKLIKRLRIQGGWSTRQYSMDYDHEDYVTGETIRATPQNMWKEPVLTGGIIARIGPMEWIFQSIKRTGTGMPGREVSWRPWDFRFLGEGNMLAGGDILAPPTGMEFEKTPVIMHRLTMVFWF